MPAAEHSDQLMLDWPEPGVARLTLSRADEFNTITLNMLDALEAAVASARAEKARVMIVTGSGRAFCAGAHVAYFTDADSPFATSAHAIRDGYVRRIIAVFAKLRDAPFATIAAINGFALGGGCELALACDFRLMAAGAKIGLTEARLGALAGAGGVQLLAKTVGRAKALEILLLADQWRADEAKAVGLVNAVHEEAELEEAALTLARRLLACSPITIAETKRALRRCETASEDEADAIALDAVGVAAAGPEWREGMAAFKEKRKPTFAIDGRPGQTAGLR